MKKSKLLWGFIALSTLVLGACSGGGDDSHGTGFTPTDHTHSYVFNSFEWTTTAGAYTAKAKYVCSADASHVEYRQASMSKTTDAATCTQFGVNHWKAVYEDHQDTKDEQLPKAPHTVDDGGFCTVCHQFTSESLAADVEQTVRLPAGQYSYTRVALMEDHECEFICDASFDSLITGSLYLRVGNDTDGWNYQPYMGYRPINDDGYLYLKAQPNGTSPVDLVFTVKNVHTPDSIGYCTICHDHYEGNPYAEQLNPGYEYNSALTFDRNADSYFYFDGISSGEYYFFEANEFFDADVSIQLYVQRLSVPSDPESARVITLVCDDQASPFVIPANLAENRLYAHMHVNGTGTFNPTYFGLLEVDTFGQVHRASSTIDLTRGFEPGSNNIAPLDQFGVAFYSFDLHGKHFYRIGDSHGNIGGYNAQSEYWYLRYKSTSPNINDISHAKQSDYGDIPEGSNLYDKGIVILEAILSAHGGTAIDFYISHSVVPDAVGYCPIDGLYTGTTLIEQNALPADKSDLGDVLVHVEFDPSWDSCLRFPCLSSHYGLSGAYGYRITNFDSDTAGFVSTDMTLYRAMDGGSIEGKYTQVAFSTGGWSYTNNSEDGWLYICLDPSGQVGQGDSVSFDLSINLSV